MRKYPKRKILDNNEEYWKLYQILWGTIEFYHRRWIEHFKIFLSFNAILLSAVTFLLGYVLKENENSLRPFISLLSALGIYILYLSNGILKRISIDFRLRFNQLRRLEKILKFKFVKPIQEGKDFFFDNKDIPNISMSFNNDRLMQNDFLNKGIPQKDAYKKGTIAIGIYYVLIGIYSLFTFILNLDKAKILCFFYSIIVTISRAVC